MTPQHLVWVDIETTGLDPKIDPILEIAVVVTDRDLNVLWQFETVVPEDALVCYERANDYVRKMHTENGLWSDVHAMREAIKDLDLSAFVAELQSHLLLELAKFGIGQNAKTAICGYNPKSDLGFLQTQLPELARVFNHYDLNVRSVEMASTIWGGERYKSPDHPHRAMADVLDEIEALKFYRWR